MTQGFEYWAETYDRQDTEALDIHRRYDAFEESEGYVWSPLELAIGGLRNARQLTDALQAGDIDGIREGHSDVAWTIYSCANLLEIDRSRMKQDFIEAHRTIEELEPLLELSAAKGRILDIKDISLGLLGDMSSLPAYIMALEGRRTLPDATGELSFYLGTCLSHTVKAVAAANYHFSAGIDEDSNFSDNMRILRVKVTLQDLYVNLREGRIGKVHAEEQAGALIAQALSQGLPKDRLLAAWHKAPSRVRNMADQSFSWPALD
jgi:hypothetical protein